MNKLTSTQFNIILFAYALLFVACRVENGVAENVSVQATSTNQPLASAAASDSNTRPIEDTPDSEIEEEFETIPPPPCDIENVRTRLGGRSSFIIAEKNNEITYVHTKTRSLKLSFLSLETGELLRTEAIELDSNLIHRAELIIRKYVDGDRRYIGLALHSAGTGWSSMFVPLNQTIGDTEFFPQTNTNFSWSNTQRLVLMQGSRYSIEDDTFTGQKLFLFDPETKEVDHFYERLSNPSLSYWSASWSPTGNQIVYVVTDEAWYRQVMVYDFDIGMETPVSPPTMCAYNPVFSPDGQKIVYQVNEYDSTGFELTRQIGVSQMSETGGWDTEIISFPYTYTGYYSWSPDSEMVAFNAEISDRSGIYLLDLKSQTISLLHEDSLLSVSMTRAPVWLYEGAGLGYIVASSVKLSERNIEYFYRYTDDIASGVWNEVVISSPE
ncbi:TolB family protein [Candidatus Leptofilum sp.]|uniref:TolB family protein n=1 Tax=Candidatus Leptofilum sp. TaxID=3241576 RepID=UPI003B5CACA1